MDKTYSVCDVIEMTADLLAKVRLPIGEVDAIVTILSAIKNLKECTEAIKANTKQEEEVTEEVKEDV